MHLWASAGKVAAVRSSVRTNRQRNNWWPPSSWQKAALASGATNQHEHGGKMMKAVDSFGGDRGAGGYGIVSGMTVERTAVVAEAPEVVVANLYAQAVAAGLKAVSPVPASLRLSRSYLKREPFLFALLLIGIGVVFGSLHAGPIVWVPILLGVALLVFGRTKETVTLVVSAAEGGTTVAATGSATGRLAEFVDAVYA